MKETKQAREISRVDRAALLPYSFWAVLFVVVPLIFVAYYAFTDNSFSFTFENITRFFTATSEVTGDDGAVREVRTYMLIFWRSLKLALISTVLFDTGSEVVHDRAPIRHIRPMTDRDYAVRGRTALLDVTWPEPCPAESPFWSLPNVILTPHLAGSLGDEVMRMGEYMLEECERYLDGKPLVYDVSMEMLEHMA